MAEVPDATDYWLAQLGEQSWASASGQDRPRTLASGDGLRELKEELG